MTASHVTMRKGDSFGNRLLSIEGREGGLIKGTYTRISAFSSAFLELISVSLSLHLAFSVIVRRSSAVIFTCTLETRFQWLTEVLIG